MTIKEFDQITIGKIYYDVFDSENELINWFTRDYSQSQDLFRLNLMKKSLHEDARIVAISCINDVIHVTAVIDSKMESDWIMDDPEHYIMHCSNCNWVNVHGAAWNYCPNCGAAMREHP